MIKIKIIEKTLNKGEIIPLTFDPIFTNIFNNEENICILEDFISIYFDIPINEVIGNLKIYSKKLRIDLIDLEKIKNICYPISNKRFSLFKIFTTNKKVELVKYLEGSTMRDESKEKLIQNVERYSSDEDVFTLYTELSKSELEKNTMIAEVNDEGFKNSLVVGEKRGEKRGIGEGIAKFAKTMIQKKFNLDSISEITGLSKKELSKLSIG